MPAHFRTGLPLFSQSDRAVLPRVFAVVFLRALCVLCGESRRSCACPLFRRTVLPCQQNPRQPISMRQSAPQQFIRFRLHIVFHASNRQVFSIDHQIRSATIPVIGLADATGVGDRHSSQLANVGTMNVPINYNRSGERTVGSLQFLVTGAWHRRTPQILRTCMNQRKAFVPVYCRKGFQPSQSPFSNDRSRWFDRFCNSG